MSILPTIEGHLSEGRTIDRILAPARFQTEIEAAGYAFVANDSLIIIDQFGIDWRWNMPEG